MSLELGETYGPLEKSNCNGVLVKQIKHEFQFQKMVSRKFLILDIISKRVIDKTLVELLVTTVSPPLQIVPNSNSCRNTSIFYFINWIFDAEPIQGRKL